LAICWLVVFKPPQEGLPSCTDFNHFLKPDRPPVCGNSATALSLPGSPSLNKRVHARWWLETILA
jgi:hypothetical protein